ncbi:MAG: substrate-binding domain-containing protein [Pseudomonadota bacterium]|nr:substrate-binding domain-containing protein [Pseudomonadota bacterium]
MWSQRTRAVLAWFAVPLTTVVFAAAAHAQSVDLVAAGSLNPALTQVADAFTATTGIAVTETYMASGTLRQEIEAGLRPDVFASADTASPQRLSQEGLAGPVQIFGSNRVVAVVRSGFGQQVTRSNLLSVLLDPATRIGTSTPVADPLGDYTQQIFETAGTIVPGATATLEAKADELVANPSAPPVPAGANSLVYFLDTKPTVDIFIAYVTSAVAARALDPTLQIVALPRKLSITAPYGLTVLNDASPDSQRFADSSCLQGQQILASFGFTPPCRSSASGAQPTAGNDQQQGNADNSLPVCGAGRAHHHQAAENAATP